MRDKKISNIWGQRFKTNCRQLKTQWGLLYELVLASHAEESASSIKKDTVFENNTTSMHFNVQQVLECEPDSHEGFRDTDFSSFQRRIVRQSVAPICILSTPRCRMSYAERKVAPTLRKIYYALILG